jgi:glutaredoxin-like protein
MRLIKDRDKAAITKKLAGMSSQVTLKFFTQEIECDFCLETRELLQDLSSLGDKLKLQIFDFKDNPAEVQKYRIDKIPATVVANGKDYGIRFYGIPAGSEFSSLLDAIFMVSQGDSNLSAESKKLLQQIMAPVHLQVFVTPT